MNTNLSETEQSLANFDFEALNAQKETAQANIAAATTVDDIKTEICKVWSSIRKYVIWAEAVPIVGKFITILAELLDGICGTGGN